jgi:hypothetical protein
MTVKPCCSRHSLHLMFCCTQHNVHQSVMLMTSTTAYIYFYETWCRALAYFLGECWLKQLVKASVSQPEWIWMGSLVNEVMDFLEYVLVGTKTWRSSQDEEFEEDPPWCWVELECEAIVKGFRTANMFSLLLSSTVKSLSEKCRLHTWCFNSLLAVSALQGIPPPSAHSWALFKNVTRKYKNEIICDCDLCHIFNGSENPFVTQTIECALWWLQHVGEMCAVVVTTCWWNVRCGGYNMLVKCALWWLQHVGQILIYS